MEFRSRNMHISQKVEKRIQMPFGWSKGKQNEVYPFNGLLLGNTKE